MLSTGIGIIQAGKLVEHSNVAQLREELLRTYTVKILARATGHNTYVSAIASKIRSAFPTSVFNFQQGALLIFTIPFNDVKLNTMFNCLAKLKRRYSVEEFSLGPVSLKDIFEVVVNTQEDVRVDSLPSDCV